jgi:uncharacterized protein (DUF433 family)
MSGVFSLKEAAAIAELPESVVRSSIERRSVAPRARTVGKSVRYAFDARELFYIKLLSAFPLDLRRDDKSALRELVFRRTRSSGRWRAEGPNYVLKSGDLVLRVEARSLRTHLAQNLAAYRRGRQRLVSSPDVLGGEPVFEGTRIPLAHIAGLIAKGVVAAEILEDYPALSIQDLAFAAIHAKMKPAPGRPRKPLELRRSKIPEPVARRATLD